ncbi:inositol monophosphatase [Mycolicibacterium conceptionense]|uniref:inositol monophosphatase family protein n=1 Tax=Mycolicibacterium TaxID=1866885 RepID=UPI0007E9EA01|nr:MULTISPECIES: inositol monophosphatase family protein [Mycolicibacterium]MCW1822227.1 inositol monophosphatase [Mycolicibacterium senegalense]OBB09223.1 inositol monophosphatase [Mycolicibacterium conceptionense]OBF06009.1 inositol monophosphatase [Mycolicibacterium conceptionense]OBF46674.1 inositol monophosphatase [Mycolicibacterium conceptionense]QZH58790.1 inositol monophosphatase [Mycolicibacterium farcinogenes]
MTDNSFDAPALRVVAEQLAAEAAEFVARRRAEVFDSGQTAASAVRTKSTPTDPVTIVDTETERWLRERLAVLRPSEPVLGEEEGGREDGRDGLSWVLDPIDGTVNFVYGIPAYAVSVAVQYDGRSVAGAVANVAGGEVYSAALGHGAAVVRGGVRTPLRCSGVQDLSLALLGTGFAYDPGRRARQARVLAQVLPAVRDVRRIGSCALDLCMVAAGRLDAYYEEGVQVWDWAAAALIAAEAGATVRLPITPGDEQVIASAPGVADALRDALAGAGMDL